MGFYLASFEELCFPETFCKWVSSIFRLPRFSVLINGSPVAYLSCSRRICQGDHLSLILFGIAADFFESLFHSLVD